MLMINRNENTAGVCVRGENWDKQQQVKTVLGKLLFLGLTQGSTKGGGQPCVG